MTIIIKFDVLSCAIGPRRASTSAFTSGGARFCIAIRSRQGAPGRPPGPWRRRLHGSSACHQQASRVGALRSVAPAGGPKVHDGPRGTCRPRETLLEGLLSLAQCPPVQQKMWQILRLPAVAQPAPCMTGILCTVASVVDVRSHFRQRVHVGTKLRFSYATVILSLQSVHNPW